MDEATFRRVVRLRVRAGYRSRSSSRGLSRSTHRTGLSGMQAIGREDRDRRLEGHPRPHQVDQGRRDRPVVEEPGLGRFPSTNPSTCSRSKRLLPLAALQGIDTGGRAAEDVVDTDPVGGADKKQKVRLRIASGKSVGVRVRSSKRREQPMQRRYNRPLPHYVKEEIEKLHVGVGRKCARVRGSSPSRSALRSADRNIDEDQQLSVEADGAVLRELSPDRARGKRSRSRSSGDPRAAGVPQNVGLG